MLVLRRRRRDDLLRDVFDAVELFFASFFLFGFLQYRPNRLFLEEAADFSLQTCSLRVSKVCGDSVVGFVFADAAVAEAVRDDGIRIKLCDQLASFLVPAQSSNHVVGKWFDSLGRILKKLKNILLLCSMFL